MLEIKDLRKAEEIFREYISNYDIQDKMIKTKVKHSYKVEQLALQLAEKCGLDQEDIILQGIIGLFHDIGRFEQARIYHCFRDFETVDHADLGAQILEEEKLLYGILSQQEYEILRKAIQNHNKYAIASGLTDRELIHAKIIRDADKIDILRLRAEHDEDEGIGILKDEIEKSRISDYAFHTFMSHEMIDAKKRETALDGVLTLFCFLFDLNLHASKQIILENDYLRRIVKAYTFESYETKEQIDRILMESERYLRI